MTFNIDAHKPWHGTHVVYATHLHR